MKKAAIEARLNELERLSGEATQLGRWFSETRDAKRSVMAGLRGELPYVLPSDSAEEYRAREQKMVDCISRAELCLARLVNIGIEQAQPELE
jgi:hypothetical protein